MKPHKSQLPKSRSLFKEKATTNGHADSPARDDKREAESKAGDGSSEDKREKEQRERSSRKSRRSSKDKIDKEANDRAVSLCFI